MGKKDENRKVKICKRCNKQTGLDIICTSCKIELINKYDSKLDWKTAFEIDRMHQAAMRYINDDLS